VCLFAAEHWDFGRLFTFHNYSGDAGGGVWPPVSDWWVFALGLLLPLYTITGYDASAHTSEERLKAARSVPRAIVMSVVWSAIFGYIFLSAVALMLPSMDDAAKQGWNVFFWAFDQRVNPVEGDRLPGRLRCAASLRSGDSDLGLAHDLRLLA
jgi:amino acid transporter